MLPRVLLLAFTILALPASVQSQGADTFSNPIIPGFAPDPSIVRVGEDFYVINSTFEYFPGIPIYHSRDLINWDLIGYALHDPKQVDLDTISSGSGIHASTIRYHDGLFYIITTNNIDGELVNFVVTAEDPKGPWSDAIVIEGAPGIDPSLLFDDGRVWYVGNHAPPDPAFVGEMEIWLQELDSETLQLIGERHFLWRGCCQGAYAEGPHIYKKDGFYYLLISEGGTAYEHAMSVAISEEITGPYLNNPRNPVLSHRQLSYDHPITGVGHADIVELEDGRWYAVALGWRLVDGTHGILGRETFLLPMTWETEPYWWKEPKYTWPVFSPDTGRVELNFPTPFAGTRQRDSLVLFEDEFDGNELGLEWNMRRTHDAPFHALEDGVLRLDLQPGHLDDHGRYSFLGVRQRHFEYDAEVRLDFVPRENGEEAGVAVMQNDRSAILFTLTREDGVRRLQVYLSFHGDVEEIAAAEYDNDFAYLRVSGNYLELDFSYSADGETWTALAEDVDGVTLSPAVIHGFNYTGLYLGVFASSNGGESDNSAAFDYFRYTPRAVGRDEWYHRQALRRELAELSRR